MAGMGKSVQPQRLILCLALLAQVLSPAVGWGDEAARTSLTIAGSGTNLPIIQILAQAFTKQHPDISIKVPASIGSNGGINAVADGAIAIGLISRELRKRELGLGLTVLNYARTPLIIAVHPSVAEENITAAEFLDIYRGKKTSWKNGKEIIVLTREPGDSSIEALAKGVPDFKKVYDESRQAQRWTNLLSDQEMNETLAKTPQAIGFSDLGEITVERHRVKALKVNGVAPTLTNVETGAYRLVKPLRFVFRQEQLPATAREFLAFVRSREGAKLMQVNGYLPEK
jgi:phosphate transport system substrate-binding protein